MLCNQFMPSLIQTAFSEASKKDSKKKKINCIDGDHKYWVQEIILAQCYSATLWPLDSFRLCDSYSKVCLSACALPRQARCHRAIKSPGDLLRKARNSLYHHLSIDSRHKLKISLGISRKPRRLLQLFLHWQPLLPFSGTKRHTEFDVWLTNLLWSSRCVEFFFSSFVRYLE